MDRKESIRNVMGERLKEFRESRGLSAYRVAQKGDIQIGQVNAIESGSSNYTIDVFLGYIHGCNLYMYFAEKENQGNDHEFEELNKKGVDNHPDNI
ncbi:MAG: helix-turn-helix domain-containing protein [Bacteroides sp.]|nr:helix-turn-helix domain-containing protein [Bacteroides sp.]